MNSSRWMVSMAFWSRENAVNVKQLCAMRSTWVLLTLPRAEQSGQGRQQPLTAQGMAPQVGGDRGCGRTKGDKMHISNSWGLLYSCLHWWRAFILLDPEGKIMSAHLRAGAGVPVGKEGEKVVELHHLPNAPMASPDWSYRLLGVLYSVQHQKDMELLEQV